MLDHPWSIADEPRVDCDRPQIQIQIQIQIILFYIELKTIKH